LTNEAYTPVVFATRSAASTSVAIRNWLRAGSRRSSSDQAAIRSRAASIAPALSGVKYIRP
jgi:multidrug resistance efflux pump